MAVFDPETIPPEGPVQEYVLPPEPDKVVFVLIQFNEAGEPALAVGLALTVIVLVCVALQVGDIPIVYVTGKEPTPEVDGQNVFPETPVPDHVPEPRVYVLDGVKVAQGAPAQKGPGGTNDAL